MKTKATRKKKGKRIVLVDYKGKFSIAMDEDMVDELDVVLCDITKKELLEEAKDRKADALYYGVPAYIGNDKDLLKVFTTKEK